MSKKFIVITSIFYPSEAVVKFASLNDWRVIVVGDKKTPTDWTLEGVTYLSPEDQEKLGYDILKLLPWNHYSRKMVGYLYAMSQGAEVIYDTDDDNIPLKKWREPLWSGTFATLYSQRFVNIYSYFSRKKIWPRGLPLRLIKNEQKAKIIQRKSHVGIWQGLVNGDSDVDAIYRLVDNGPITFLRNKSYVLDKETFCPLNSQNTFFHKDAFPLLYLPAFVTFRFTDILRGLVAQPILWSVGKRVGFTSPAVFQKRNPHDYMKDFESEIPVYLHSEAIATIAREKCIPDATASKLLVNVYTELYEQNIVTHRETRLLKAWCRDLLKINALRARQ
jgi:hypothetical protein